MAGEEGQGAQPAQAAAAGAAQGIQELLDSVERHTNDIISMIEDLRFVENEYNSRKSELSARQRKFDSGELSGEVFKHLKEKAKRDFEAFEKERQESWQSILNSSAEIGKLLDALKDAYSKRASEGGTGSIEQGK